MIGLFDFVGRSSFEAYKTHGPACLTYDQLLDACDAALREGDNKRAADLRYYIRARTSQMLRRQRRR